MKGTYQYAVVSICTDLTDPKATSVPVGLLLLIDGMGVQFAVVAARQEVPELADNLLLQTIVSQVPEIIKKHVNKFYERQRQASKVRVLSDLEQALRNSVHVSFISKERPFSLDSVKELERLALLRAKAALAANLRKVERPDIRIQQINKSAKKALPFGYTTWHPKLQSVAIH